MSFEHSAEALQILALEKLRTWRVDPLHLPTLDELMKALNGLSASTSSKGLLGLAHGLKIALRVTEHGSDMLFVADSGLIDSLDMADCFGIPVCTTIVQSLKWGALAYAGHIETATAVGRVALSATMVGGGAGVGAILGTVLIPIPGLGTFIGGALGGWAGGRGSKAMIYAPFINARDRYLREKDRLPVAAAAERQRRNETLNKSAVEKNCSYEASLASLVPIGDLPLKGTRIGSAIKSLQAQQNKLQADYLAEFNRHLEEYAKVVAAGIDCLNIIHEEMTDAMKQLGMRMP